MRCEHDFITMGEDTGGFQKWCKRCGAIKDSGGIITLPEKE